MKDTCAVYCRVSTDQQKDNYSIKIQEQRGRDFCKNNGFNCEFYKDVKSGSTIKDRLEFNRLITEIQTSEIKAVWIIEFSRLTRNDENDSLFIKSLFIEFGIKLYENGTLIEFTSPEDNLFYNFRSSIAAYERRKIAERMQNGLTLRNSKGLKIYPRLFGYDYKNKIIYINKQQEEVINYIFKRVYEKTSYNKICEELMIKGSQKWNGQTNWKSSDISKIIRQSVYRGLVSDGNGKFIESKLYDPIITQDLWDKTRPILKEKNEYVRKNSRRIGTFELSGMLTCNNCGGRYFRKNNTKRLDGITIEKGFYIHETSSTRKIDCKKNLTTKTIDEKKICYLVRAIYLKCFEDSKFVEKMYETKISDLKLDNQNLLEEKKLIEKNIKVKNQGINNLIDAVISGIFNNSDILEKKQQITKDKDILQQRLGLLDANSLNNIELEQKLNELANKDTFDFWDLSEKERKELYLKNIKELTIENSKKLTIVLINDYKLTVEDINDLNFSDQNHYDMVEKYYKNAH